jgi:hypothetical protein
VTRTYVVKREQAFFLAENAVVADEEGVSHGDAFVQADDCYIRVAHYPDRAPRVLGIVFGRRGDGPDGRDQGGA